MTTTIELENAEDSFIAESFLTKHGIKYKIGKRTEIKKIKIRKPNKIINGHGFNYYNPKEKSYCPLGYLFKFFKVTDCKIKYPSDSDYDALSIHLKIISSKTDGGSDDLYGILYRSNDNLKTNDERIMNLKSWLECHCSHSIDVTHWEV